MYFIKFQKVHDYSEHLAELIKSGEAAPYPDLPVLVPNYEEFVGPFVSRDAAYLFLKVKDFELAGHYFNFHYDRKILGHRVMFLTATILSLVAPEKFSEQADSVSAGVSEDPTGS